MLLVKETVVNKSEEESSKLLANLTRLQISRPDDFDWKEDYAKALEEKYESIY